MGLFSKKSCDICGGEIGMLGNKKLEDGNMCKNCAKKLSPWFKDRKHTSLADIKDQLEYREVNQAEVEKFNPTLTLGTRTLVMIDEDNSKFIVTSAKKWRDENPDVFRFSDVLGCEMTIDHSSYDETEDDKDGHSVKTGIVNHTYTFKETIRVRNPYFDTLDFDLGSVHEETGTRNSGLNLGGININLGAVNSGGSEHSAEYYNLVNIGQEIKTTLMEARQDARQQAAQAAMPKVAVTCKCCGANTIPDAAGRCEYCGGAAV